MWVMDEYRTIFLSRLKNFSRLLSEISVLEVPILVTFFVRWRFIYSTQFTIRNHSQRNRGEVLLIRKVVGEYTLISISEMTSTITLKEAI